MYSTLRMLLCGALLIAALFTMGVFTSSPDSTAYAAPMQHVAATCPPTIDPSNPNAVLVAKLQADLNAAYNAGRMENYPYDFHPPLPVDGNFSLQTKYALYDFQWFWGIPIDGIIGPQTWHDLGEC